MTEANRFAEFLSLARAIKDALADPTHQGFVTRMVMAAREKENLDNQRVQKDLVLATALLSAAFEFLKGFEFSDVDLREAKQTVVEELQPAVYSLIDATEAWAKDRGINVVTEVPPVSKSEILAAAERYLAL